jgi:membrane-bound lytic murein transglycosylase B
MTAALVVALGTVVPASNTGAAVASDVARGDAQRMATQLDSASASIASATANLARLQAAPPTPVAIDQVRADLVVGQAGFTQRDAIRQEQDLVYQLASQPDLESATLPLLAAPRATPLAQADQALRALWDMSGIGAGASIHPRRNKRFADSEPVEALLGYYRAAAARAGIDWTYLAAINYVESDFGRVLGPSSAGALGPMQFLPATFREYGGSGDIMSSRDSIQAAALLLARNGAPGDYDRAILRYNHSADYVKAVEGYAAAMRADGAWLTRLYYWSTYG